MLLVRGLLMPRSIMVAVTLRVCSPRLSKKAERHRVLEQAELTEQGKGVAAGVAHGGRPPGAPEVRKCAARSKPPRLATRNSPPQMVPSVPAPVPSKAMPRDTRVGCKLARGDGFGHYARDMRMMVLHLDERQIAFSRLLARPLAR